MKNIYFKIILVYLIISGSILSAQIPSYLPTSNLVGWWPFNNNANDESGNGLNASLQNGVIATTDRYGNLNSAYNFDGVDDRIFVNNAFFDNGWNQYTFSCWVNLTTVNNTNNQNSSNFVLNTSPHNGLCFGANWLNSGKYTLFAGNGSWDGVFNGSSNQSAVAGNWKHLILTKNSNTYKLYVNGTLDKIWTSAVTLVSNNYKIYFGGTDPATGTNEVLKGKLDDIGIWDRELTQTEITTVFQSGSAGVIDKGSLLEFCKVFPNPANKNLILDFNESSFQKLENDLDVSISSIDGKIVKEIQVNRNDLKGNYKFDIEELSQGLYFLKLKSGNYFQNIKFIKE